MSDQRTLADWLRYQQQVHPKSIDLELVRVSSVARRLQLLPASCPSIIVGGTNGKGSTASYAASFLKAAGERVGLFTSPHLRYYNERIQIDGALASDEALIAAFEEIESARGSATLTFFEYSTLAALLLFRERRVTAMVLEVGLGGRLDATNIVDAEVAVVCSIGLDHTDWLGTTLEEIGREKAGIFRPGRPVVLGSRDMPDSVGALGCALGCPTLVAQVDFDWQVQEQGQWHYRDLHGGLSGLPAPTLLGPIQYRNAATALCAVRSLPGRKPQDPQLAQAQAAHGLRAVRLQGRLQVLAGPVEWLLDVAHNAPAAIVLVAALRERSSARRTFAVFGMLADKDAATVAALLDPLVDRWLLCGIEDSRGLSAPELRARMGELRGVTEFCGSVREACARARQQAEPGDRILVCGSFHVVGPALDWLGL